MEFRDFHLRFVLPPSCPWALISTMSSLPQPKVVGLVLLISILSVICGFLLGRNNSPHSIVPTSTAISPLLAAGQLTPQQRDRLNRLENLIQTRELTQATSHAIQPFLPLGPASSSNCNAATTECPVPPTIGEQVQSVVSVAHKDWSDADFSHITLWSTDYHITPIADLKYLLSQFGIKIIDKSLSGACGSMKTCAQDLKVLTTGNGYHVGTNPERLSRQLFEAYKDDEEFRSVDAIVCFHPIATCQLYMPFNKSLIMISSTRYEHGQHDAENWLRFNWMLQLASHNPRHLIGGNSVYDADYIKYFTDVDAIYIPSFCGQITARYKAGGTPPKSEFLLGHSHASLHKDTGWGGGLVWAEMRKWIEEEQAKSSDEKIKKVVLKGINELYGHYEYQDLANHPAIVHMPYQVSVMSMFEQYRMNVPLFYPSLRFLTQLQMDHAPLSERTWARVYGRGQLVQSDILGHTNSWWPDPNNDRDAHALQFWLAKSDFYVKPHIQYYDSWADLLVRLTTTDLPAVSRHMADENARVEAKLKRQWKGLLMRMFKDRPEGGYAMPDSYESGMREMWGVKFDSNGDIKRPREIYQQKRVAKAVPGRLG